ncbi:ras-related protein rab7 isoform X2 [Parambassis ranga]|uniref:Ras-related protein Rab-7b n=1 Tax=Parambassis ranga TaxID=210632 RepID=A0A6P7IBI4_9TELE|nr:ras-related protein rab7-like isoform X2 [Parambassis ranga]
MRSHLNMSDEKDPVTLKIILIGNSGTVRLKLKSNGYSPKRKDVRKRKVGKSSFMNRYVYHRFTNMYRATIGTDFLSKTIDMDGDSVTLQIWDTAGTERFQSLGTPLYRGTHCCMLVFDVTSRTSFLALEEWRKEFLVQAEPQDPSDFPFIVLGNKCDLSGREVSHKKALQWCEETGAEYFEVSAKEDVNVEKPFMRAGQRGLQQYKKHTLENTGHFQITCKQPRETRNTCEC